MSGVPGPYDFHSPEAHASAASIARGRLTELMGDGDPAPAIAIARELLGIEGEAVFWLALRLQRQFDVSSLVAGAAARAVFLLARAEPAGG